MENEKNEQTPDPNATKEAEQEKAEPVNEPAAQPEQQPRKTLNMQYVVNSIKKDLGNTAANMAEEKAMINAALIETYEEKTELKEQLEKALTELEKAKKQNEHSEQDRKALEKHNQQLKKENDELKKRISGRDTATKNKPGPSKPGK